MSTGLWLHLVAACRPRHAIQVLTIAHPMLEAILAEDPTGYALCH